MLHLSSLFGQDGWLLHLILYLCLSPASQTYKKPQRGKIIYSWHAFHRMQRMIDQFEDFLVEYPVRVISVAVV